MKHVDSGISTLPILAEADFLVLGASFAGAACAITLAKAGKRVVLVEPSTYPGREVCATLRYWLPESAFGRGESEFPGPFLKDFLKDAISAGTGGAEIPLRPDAVKRGMEDALISAGVELIYASRPAGTIESARELHGAVIANKSGLQAVLADSIVDATDWADFARLSGVRMESAGFPCTLPAWRVIEYTGVKGELPGSIDVPAGLKLANNRIQIHRGYRAEGHFLLEFGLDITLPSGDHRGRMSAEISARSRSIAVARWLAETAPAFRGAWLAGSSWKLAMASPWRQPAGTSAGETRERPNLHILGSASNMEGDREDWILVPQRAAGNGYHLAHTILKNPGPRRGNPDKMLAILGESLDSRRSPYSMKCFEYSPSVSNGHRVMAAKAAIPVSAECDVLVGGGGTSGAVAAAVAASRGVRTTLLEMNDGLGGTGTAGGVDSYWFGLRNGFTADIDRRYSALERELDLEKRATWNIEARMQAFLDWNLQAGAEVLLDCGIAGAVVEGTRVCGLVAATSDGLQAYLAKTVVDATGDGDVAAHAGAGYTYGSERDRVPMWYSLGLFEEPGKPLNSFTSTVDVSDIRDYTRAILAGRRRGNGHDHATYLAPRESRHINGDATITVKDMLMLRQHHDTVCICFSNCDIKGKSSSDYVSWGLLPPNCEVEIPYGALLPAGLEGIIIAGKAYSCTHDVLATARMQADMQNLGGAAGLAAALAARSGKPPRSIAIVELQESLEKSGALPAGIRGRAAAPQGRSAGEIVPIIDGLTGDEPLYLEQGFDECTREPMKVALLLAEGKGLVSHMEKAFMGANGKRKLLLARILSWHGSRAGIPLIIEAVEKQLASGKLPGVERDLKWGDMPPDQGQMPESCYLLRAAAMAGDPRIIPVLERIAGMLDPSPDDFRDKEKGLFCYVDTICACAERLGDPAALTALETLHSRSSLRGLAAKSFQPDFSLERRALLELGIGCAMARCGSMEGREILRSYLDDSRAILRRHAQDEVNILAGNRPGHPHDLPKAREAGPGKDLPLPFRRALA